MKVPDKICIRKDDTAPFGFTRHCIYTTKVQEHDIEYIRKDIVDETIKTTEDHAYFAGQEKFREKLLKCINEIRAIPHDNAIARDLAFQEIINKINSM